MFAPMTKASNTPTDRVIVVFKEKIDSKVIEQVGGKIDHSYHNVSAISVDVSKADISKLENNKKVMAVEPDKKVKITGQIDDWGIKDVKAPLSWKSNYTGKGIKVAVLDTGISQHEDLSIAGGVSFTTYTKSFLDDNGHGTHVAGIIGARNNNVGVVGVAPDTSLYAVKVLDSNGSGYLSDIISGIDWAIKNQMDIINLSFGTPEDSVALKQIVDEAYNKGILIVAAAGNGGNSAGTGDTTEYPAKYKSVIAVSAVDQNNKRGTFSATGSDVEVAAPGVNVLSTYMQNEYAYMSGTSMAAPFVSGTLALLKQANPTLTNIQLREKLEKSALDLGIKGKDNLYGYGLIQGPFNNQLAPSKSGKGNNPITVKVPSNKTSKEIKVIKKVSSTKISTYRTTYRVGNTVWITTKVLDKKTTKPISSASMKLVISSSKGTVKSIKANTNSKGFASFKMATNRHSLKGYYNIKTTVTKTGYNQGYAVKTIKLY
jgi:minor extracellular protease Epr